MAPLLCPRCQRPNPDIAQFCHYDGAELGSGRTSAGAGKLLKEFAFPSGKKCRTFDELAQACQDDWVGSRELLRRGVFVDYFSSVGRMDLARAAKESMDQANPDIGLCNFVGSLPQTRGQGARLDLRPRRLVLGTFVAGETQQVPLVVSNQGKGMLQGTLTVAEGGEWLRIQGASNGQCSVKTAGEQEIQLQIDTRGLAAGQAYGARLTVVTNGGVVDLPARLEVAPQPFQRPPFQGVRAQRELAERMRAQPKAAVPLLESGEVGRWFEANGWNYPVRGNAARGVAGVQQFFESLGLSKPPTVRLSQSDVFHICKYPEGARGQVALQTPAKKWVYANVESDAPWLTVLTPSVSGPQQAQIGYEIDVRKTPPEGMAEGHLTALANGGQKLTLRVLVQVEGLKPTVTRRVLQPVLTCILAFFLTRLALLPVMDVYGRGVAATEALARVTTDERDRVPLTWGNWLKLPWAQIYLDPRPELLDDVLGKAKPAQVDRTRDFRDYFTGRLLAIVIGSTFWIGGIAGIIVLWRRGSFTDAPWGCIAGAAAGVAASATVGCIVMVGDLGPHILWDSVSPTPVGGFVLLPLWALLVLAWWMALGAALGIVLTLLGPFGRPFLYVQQVIVSGGFRLVGMGRLGDYFAPL